MGNKLSKLELIQKTLEKRAKEDIIIYPKHYPIENINMHANFSSNHLVEYWIAPKKGIYLAYELQDFMEDIVPALEVFSKEDFSHNVSNEKKFLRVGNLIWTEEFGTKIIPATTIILEDKYLLSKGFLNEQSLTKKSTLKLRRKIIINLFPNFELMKEAFKIRNSHDSRNNLNHYYISLKAIRKYCPDVKKRIRNYEKEREIKERELNTGQLSLLEDQTEGGLLTLTDD